MAYVYMGTSHTSDEWYVGYRSNPTIDLGSTYFTSSKIVKPRFSDFTWIILGEFENPKDAYDMEQEYIHILWDEPGRLNRVCHYGQKRFSMLGSHHVISEAQRQKISKANRGKVRTPEMRAHLSAAKAGVKRKPHSEETKRKISEGNKGLKKPPATPEQCAKLSAAASQGKQHVRCCVIANKKEMTVQNFTRHYSA